MENNKTKKCWYPARDGEIDLMQMVKFFLHHVKTILACVVLVAIIGAFLALLSPRNYFASSLMYVNYLNTSNGTVGGNPYTTTSESLSAASSLVDTFGVLLMHDETLNQIIELESLDCETDELAANIGYYTSGAQMIRVDVKSRNKDEAVAISKDIADIMPKKLADRVEGCSVSVVEVGKLQKIGSRMEQVINNGKMGAALGLVAACAVFLVLFLLDKHIYTAKYLSEVYPGLPVLAEIPDPQHTKTGVSLEETYKLLRTYLMFPIPGAADARLIGVTSALRQEGKTMVTANLARVLAQAGKKVLFLEGDMRHPSAAKTLGLQNVVPGFAEALQKDGVNVTVQSCAQGFDVAACGAIPANPSELLCSQQMHEELERFRQQYDYVLVDLPPVMEAADAVEVSHMLDGMLLVVRAGLADRDSLSTTMKRMSVTEAYGLGFVFNGMQPAQASKHRTLKLKRRH